MGIKILATGGTIDKLYYDAVSDYRIGDPQVIPILREAGVTVDYEVESVLKLDSLDMGAAERDVIYEKVCSLTEDRVVITHGTDTMLQTARTLQAIEGKTIVLTGAMRPARFRDSDAAVNIGFALATVQTLPANVYVAMNGRVLMPEIARKNREQGCFEPIEQTSAASR